MLDFFLSSVSSLDTFIFFGTQVVYDDGDVERLHLKNEKWEFIDEVCPCSLTPLSILSSHFLIHLLPAGARQQS